MYCTCIMKINTVAIEGRNISKIKCVIWIDFPKIRSQILIYLPYLLRSLPLATFRSLRNIEMTVLPIFNHHMSGYIRTHAKCLTSYHLLGEVSKRLLSHRHLCKTVAQLVQYTYTHLYCTAVSVLQVYNALAVVGAAL